jgi:hypothetical protein
LKQIKGNHIMQRNPEFDAINTLLLTHNSLLKQILAAVAPSSGGTGTAPSRSPSSGGAELGEGTATVIATDNASTDESTWPSVGSLDAWRIPNKMAAEIIHLTNPAAYAGAKVIKLQRSAMTADPLSTVHYNRHLAPPATPVPAQWALWASDERVVPNGNPLATGPLIAPAGWTRQYWTIHVGTTKAALEAAFTGMIFRDVSSAGSYFASRFHDQMYVRSNHYDLSDDSGNNIYIKRMDEVPTSISEGGSSYARFTYAWSTN